MVARMPDTCNKSIDYYETHTILKSQIKDEIINIFMDAI